MLKVLRDQTLELLSRFGLTAEASIDEQQLIDSSSIKALIDASNPRASDTVLEIGPGAGNITAELAARVTKVYAIEKNQKFIPLLEERFSNSANVEVIFGDALTVYLPFFDVLVSNPPYAITEAILHRLKRLKFRIASLIVPSTLAHSLTVDRGDPDYTKLTLEARLFYEIKIIREVKQESYHPKPKTTTFILAMSPKEGLKPFEAVMKQLLNQRDKKSRNALREAMISASLVEFPSTKKAAKRAVDQLGLSEAILNERVARLNLGEIMQVYEKLEHFSNLLNTI